MPQLNICEGEMYGVWKVLEANVINPETKDKHYKGKKLFSKCLCTSCNETIRFIRNSDLKKYADKKCIKCTVRERNKKTWCKIGDQYGLLTVIGDDGIKGNDSDKRHHSLCQCQCGTIVSVSDNKLKTGNTSSCGKCLTSKGEQKIISILQKANILFDHNVMYIPFYQDTGCRYRFDFIIYKEDGKVERFIEFDGRQHFTGPDTAFWSRTNDTLKDIQMRDNIKNQWCKENGYILIRIPYTQLNNLTLEMLYDKKWEV